ncbi:MAG: hypothetical protein PVF37_05425 [Desulfobacterales bacterium]|jgi:hypothetical protein
MAQALPVDRSESGACAKPCLPLQGSEAIDNIDLDPDVATDRLT